MGRSNRLIVVLLLYDALCWGSQDSALIDIHQKAGPEQIGDLRFAGQAERRTCWERERMGEGGGVLLPHQISFSVQFSPFSIFCAEEEGDWKERKAEDTRKKRLGCEACSGSFYAHGIKLQRAREKK